MYFVPLHYLAILPWLLAIPMFFVERADREDLADPRAQRLLADERTLRKETAGGDEGLSRSVYAVLSSTPFRGPASSSFQVFTRTNQEGVLVLVQTPYLKGYDDATRVKLIGAVVEAVSADGRCKRKELYVGVKGAASYGAVRLPGGEVKLGVALSKSLLFDFYKTPYEEEAFLFFLDRSTNF
jgi:hypothetical protein